MSGGSTGPGGGRQTLESLMDTNDRLARTAGVLYLLMGAPAVFSLFYVPRRLIVPGNASVTANNILDNQLLFRFGIVAELTAAVFLLLLAMVLYRLFSRVDTNQARLMLALVVVSVAITFANALNDIAALIFFRGADYLTIFDKSQRDGLGMVFLGLHRQGIAVVGVFWGVWLLPFGLLVMRSGSFPRILGILLILNCVGYVAASTTTLLVPAYSGTVSRAVMPTLLGELWIMLWLLIKGARMPAAGPA
jgi:uncharacterized protein DUF4386